MKRKTWPVFLIGLGSLLLLILLPGIAALRQADQVFNEVHELQISYEHTQSVLTAIEDRLLQASFLVRDFLLDSAVQQSVDYERRFAAIHAENDADVSQLGGRAPPDQRNKFAQLKSQIDAYLDSLEPVFAWTPAERRERASYFLREQQRPRRESIVAIAHEISDLNVESHLRQYEDIRLSQSRYRFEMQTAVALAFLLGTVVAAATTFRMSVLEKRAEQQRLATEKVQAELRSLSARLMQAQEEERLAISRELHDEVGQVLTGLRIELGRLEKVREAPIEVFRRHLDEVKGLVDQTVRTVRNLAMGLRPSVLDLGLEPALRWQVRQFTRSTGTEARLHIGGTLPELPQTHVTCIYRVVQEALTNCARYAQAKHVDIAVKVEDSSIQLEVSDDGVGLPDGWKTKRGFGLVGMEERVRELGGVVYIGSKRNSGARIRVGLPLPENGADGKDNGIGS
jgi:signal transduction histidine kinase